MRAVLFMAPFLEWRQLGKNKCEPKTVQRTGVSRFAQRQIERHRRLAPVADLCVRHQHALTILSDLRGIDGIDDWLSASALRSEL